jgi:hypothetical protein
MTVTYEGIQWETTQSKYLKSKSWQVNASFPINFVIMFTRLLAKLQGFCHSTLLNQKQHTTADLCNSNYIQLFMIIT